ncbi:hypothetical protein C8J57DRAFT_1068705, partial [Mycena rebaudengoi]
LSALARTCTAFCNPALDVLWRNQDTIVNLLQCMPKDLWEINARGGVNGSKDITDWERAQFYLHRVKSFSMRGFLPSTDFLDTLSLCLLGEYLFPNLAKLEWNPYPSALFPHVRLFLAPQIKDLLLGPIESISDLSILSNLVAKCPSLTQVRIFTDSLPAVEEIPAISMFVRGLKHVEFLNVSWLDGTALSHLAELPSVKSLLFRDCPWQSPLKSSRHATMCPTRGFPALQHLLFLYTTLPCAAELLSLASNCPLADLEISTNAGEPTNSVSRKFYATLAPYCAHPSLRTIDIRGNSNREAQSAPGVDQINLYAVGVEILQPLFSFNNLVDVYLAHPVGFQLDDSAVFAMASAWPRLQCIALVASRYRHMDSRVTLEGVYYAFARHCPNLGELRMTFDGTVVPELLEHGQSRAAQERLTVMDVAFSPIHRPQRVSTFLSKIFPGLKRIETLWIDLFLDEEITDPAVAASHDLWREVAVVLK